MKIIGLLIIIGVLLSYAPMFPMDECPEEKHMGNMKMDCGYNFHCPLIFDIIRPVPSTLPLSGRVVLTPSSLKIDELTSLIFRPPEYIN